MNEIIYKTVDNCTRISYNPDNEKVLIENNYEFLAEIQVEFLFDFLYKSLLSTSPKSIHVARRRGQLRLGFKSDIDFGRMAQEELNIPPLELI